MLSRLEALSSQDLQLLPTTGDELFSLYPNSKEGFDAAFDASLMRGRIDAVVECQDAVGVLAQRNSMRLRAIPSGQACGVALASVQAVTALIVRDLVGSCFSDEDRERGSNPPFFIPKATSLTQEHIDSAIAPWSAAFGPIHL